MAASARASRPSPTCATWAAFCNGRASRCLSPTVEPLTVRYRDMFALMADLRAMGATNALLARLRKPSSRRLFLRAAEIYAERFSDPDGRVRATFELIFVSGWAPHESQQKPLRPGSAKMRLEDALKGAKPAPE